jgi:hypothetical protein
LSRRELLAAFSGMMLATLLAALDQTIRRDGPAADARRSRRLR